MQKNSACIINYGCQMNEYESSTVSKMLEAAGFTMVKNPDQAELVLLNTCTVRDQADEKVWNRLDNLIPQKRKFKAKKVAVLGCMVEAQRDAFLKRYPQIDLLLSPAQLKNIGTELEQVTNRNFDSYESYEYVHEANSSLFKSYLPIQTGCNFNCTYCIVPAVKGREVNHSPETLLNKVNSLVRSGVREVTLLGQTINSYRWEKTRFADLLESLASNYPSTWFRFLTSHPVLFDLRIIDVMSRYKNLCPFVHIPAQSGSDRILRSMKRGYTASKYLDLINTIREKIPGVCISTDMICGFPGETEEDFKQSLNLMQRVRFETAFMFFYSERKETVAAEMQDSIPVEVRKQRLQQMIDLQMDLQSTIYQERLGNVVEVLVEGRARRGKDFLKARSAGNFPVFFEGDSNLIGSIQKVRLIHASSHSFKAELIPQERLLNA